MLDDDNRVAVFDETVEEREECGEVAVVEPSRRFVHDVNLAAPAEFACEFQPLDFSARHRACRLTKREVTESDVCEILERGGDLAAAEESDCFVNRELQRLLDVLAFVGVAERCLVLAVSAALFADNLHGFGERHVIDDLACAAARLARALGIEAE